MAAQTISSNYRQIWEQAYGSIPKDRDGRSYEIHHIDGNRNNNALENLICIPIQEHYDIHHKQGDWGACAAIVMRMKLSPKEISEMISEMNQEKIKSGVHNFQDPQHQKMLAENRAKRIIKGTHNFSGDNNPSRRKKLNGEKLWMETEEGRKRLSEAAKNQKTNVFRNGNHPLFKKYKCVETGKISTKTGFTKMAKNRGLNNWPYELVLLVE